MPRPMTLPVSNQVADEARVALRQAQEYKKTLRNIYFSEEKVPMYLSPMYRPYFGNNMRVMINGISIYFPVDGSTHSVPKSFADELTRRRKCIDMALAKQHRMADIRGNYERAPGELNLF